MSRPRGRSLLGLAAAACALGAVTLAYRGPNQVLVRAHLGDVAVTMLVFALLGLAAAWAWPRRWARRLAAGPTRAALTLAIAALVEVAQAGWLRRLGLDGLVLGTTFDPYDLLAYGLGVGVALAWPRGAAARGSVSG